MVELLYIPGLNNYDDDRVHIGPFRFFRMHEVLAQHLEKHNIRLIPIYPSRESLDKKVEEIAQKIKTTIKDKTIVIGHSTGGIIARALLKNSEVRKKIKGVITFGCPHQGSHLADLAQRLSHGESRRLRALKLFGYDVGKNLKFISDLSQQNLKVFFSEEPQHSISIYSLVCTRPVRQLPLAFRLLYSYSGEKIDFATDGIVAEQSQSWGKTLGPFDLDHLAQIGFFKHLVQPQYRRQSIAEFDRLIKTMANIVQELHCQL